MRLFDLADYFAHLVDARSTGLFHAERSSTYRYVLATATVLKATTQWFAEETSGRQFPKFLLEAERYLAEQPENEPIVWLATGQKAVALRSGPVVRRTGGRGRAGRIHAVTRLKKEILQHLKPMTQADLQEEQAAFRRGDRRRAGPEAPIAQIIGNELIFGLVEGGLAEQLHLQPFAWDFDDYLDRLTKAAAAVLDHADIGLDPGESNASRLKRLDSLVERIISKGLKAIGIRRERDLFRDRRG